MELLGLPYDVAINDPSLMRMESSALMRNQLKKFASGSEKSFGTVQREVYERTKRTLPGGPGGDAPVVNKGLMELEESTMEKALAYIENKVTSGT